MNTSKIVLVSLLVVMEAFTTINPKPFKAVETLKSRFSLLVPDILITVTLSSGLFSIVTVNTEPPLVLVLDSAPSDATTRGDNLPPLIHEGRADFVSGCPQEK